MPSPEQIREELENHLIRDVLLSIVTSDEWDRLLKEGRLKKIREEVREALESDEGISLIRKIIQEANQREGSHGPS